MKMSLAVLLLFTLFLPACKTLELNSRWRDTEVTIDGNASEWEGKLSSLEDRDVRFGVVNDSRDLYFCLVTADRDLQRQIMRAGLTLWFDRKAGEDKTFGIRFPLPQFTANEGERRERPFDRPPDSTMEFRPPLSSEVEVFGPEEHKSQHMTLMETGGIDVRLGYTHNTLVYEAKIPLTDYGPTPFAIGTQPGSTIGIGIETMSRGAAERGSGRPPRGAMGRGGYGEGRRGRSEYGAARTQGESMKPISVWISVALHAQATADSTGISNPH